MWPGMIRRRNWRNCAFCEGIVKVVELVVELDALLLFNAEMV